MACSKCSINRGENSKTAWEACKRKNLEYKYPVNRQSVLNSLKTIKDPQIRSALELSPQEMSIANQLYLRSDK